MIPILVNVPTDPARVVAAMEQAGWVRVGYRTGEYVRLAPPTEEGISLMVPLDSGAPEYRELMGAVVATLTRRLRWAASRNVPWTCWQRTDDRR